jgi:hypothetical protein
VVAEEREPVGVKPNRLCLCECAGKQGKVDTTCHIDDHQSALPEGTKVLADERKLKEEDQDESGAERSAYFGVKTLLRGRN